MAFFLPWVQISCGPIKLRFSGYEFATGRWEEKLTSWAEPIEELGREFQQEAERQMEREFGKSFPRRPSPEARRPQPEQPRRPLPVAKRDPFLWIVPGGCAGLLLLGLLGLPRAPTVLISVVAAAYLGYFGVSFEQQASDPRQTGGLLEHHWLLGFWAVWLGLMVPMFIALCRPRR